MSVRFGKIKLFLQNNNVMSCVEWWQYLKEEILKENQMERMQSFDSQFQKNIFKELPEQPQLKQECSEQDFIHNPTNQNLSLDHNPHSLALGVRNSIENGLPIPRHMLSHSDDPDGVPAEDPYKEMYYNQKIKMQVSEEDKEWFVEQLGLNELLYLKKFPSNTKNVLRNFGNAQNQYILYHREALSYVNNQLANPEKFFKWVRNMRLEKFEDFRDIWSGEGNPVLRRVYRELCFKFYQECAIPYVLASRMKCNDTKLSHLRYIYRFLQGLKDPYEFTYFKKVER